MDNQSRALGVFLMCICAMALIIYLAGMYR